MKRHKKRDPAERATAKTGVAARRDKLKAGAVVERVRKIVDPLCTAEGIELVHLEYRRESAGRVLRLYIDKPGGIRVDDCAMISRQVSDYLDVALELEETYRLEVSSPGTARPLVRAQDFERFKGHTARIRTREALNGSRNFKGVLLGMSGGMIRLSVGNETLDIPIEQVDKAALAE